MNTYPTLIRREFWEHRPLWIAPLAVSASVILLTGVAAMQVSMPEISSKPTPFTREGLLVGGMASVIGIHLVVATIVIGFYLLDCLYAERKDRSILFWKSLPVSDTNTVLSKFIVACVIVPLGVYLLAGVTGLIATAILQVRFHEITSEMWDLSSWARMYSTYLLGLISCMLWFAPVIAYLMLVSAWARRSVLLWASLPPVVALLLEEYAFDTHYVATFLKYRLGLPPGIIGTKEGVTASVGALLADVVSPLGLWLGLAAAAVLLFGAIRIRRFRDDT